MVDLLYRGFLYEPVGRTQRIPTRSNQQLHSQHGPTDWLPQSNALSGAVLSNYITSIHNSFHSIMPSVVPRNVLSSRHPLQGPSSIGPRWGIHGLGHTMACLNSMPPVYHIAQSKVQVYHIYNNVKADACTNVTRKSIVATHAPTHSYTRGCPCPAAGG